MLALIRECIPVTLDVIEHIILPMCFTSHLARVDWESDNFLITNTLTGRRACLTLNGRELQLIGKTVYPNSSKTIIYLGGMTFAALANDTALYSYIAIMFTIIVDGQFTFKLHSSIPGVLLMPIHCNGNRVHLVDVLNDRHVHLDVGGTHLKYIRGADAPPGSYEYRGWHPGFYVL